VREDVVAVVAIGEVGAFAWAAFDGVAVVGAPFLMKVSP
jgi:hypothetical protein